MSSFKKASKASAKLRAAFFGPSGSGKTFTALRVATGIGGKIAVIDTERGSASKYADRFTFDVAELADKTIPGYTRTIREAGDAGYQVLIIDSLSHAWQELLEEIDAVAKTKYRGNTWSAWSEGTPKQRKLVDAILNFPGHVIATMRSKTEWQTTQNDRGKSTPTRVGLAPEQGKGIEYEFDLLLEISTEHMATVIKDRTGKFQDKIIDRPDEAFGKALSEWLADGETAPVVRDPSPPPLPQSSGGNGAGRPDTRPYPKLLSDGVESCNRELAQQFPDDPPTLNVFEVNRHMLKAAIARGVEFDPPLPDEANKLKDGQISRVLSEVYAGPERQWVRRELSAYIGSKLVERREERLNQIQGDTAIDDETVDIEATEAGARG